MPLYIADFLADTAHLSAVQVGAYLLLIMVYWRRGNALPDDDRALAQVTRQTAHGWARLRPIMEPFFTVEGGVWLHKRIELELKIARAFSATASAKGKISGIARKKKNQEDSGTGAPTVLNTGGNREGTGDEPSANSSPSPSPDKKRSEEEVKPNGAHAPGPPAPDACMVAVEAWNALASDLGLSVVQRLTDPRRRSLRARLTECGGIEGWHAALARVRASPFLLGQTGKAWKANFDFLLQQSSFTKLMEGAYDSVKGTDGGGLTGWGAVAAELAGDHRR